ncbi:acyltransferase family protein [Aestuariibacter sp. A3R04]|uniref:acyltransferase family protein n=1 Tax=Aestuariibacter sp. A3R04 TaxID=2841571 RepID=UPI001C0A3D86|nr:DUF5009 domain-containing protein [Aestuariibacter sp. A3R04]MBU3023980.1 DUF1624 domain-containing protein [Aestuariibacter sp. A3R04]
MNRIAAIDVMRGLTIVLMVLVNNPGSWGSVYWPLLHAKWHGLTPTDLVFPFFVFIMGVAVAISLRKHDKEVPSVLPQLQSIAKRSVILFGLGLLLTLFYVNTLDANYSWLHDKLYKVRVMGVLQRLGLVYLLTAPLLIFLSQKGQRFVLVGCLLGYWTVMTFVPYSDEQGNVYQGMWAYGNSVAAWLDNAVFGQNHVYYRTASPFPFDPEGLLSTVPAVASCLFGVVAGQWILAGGCGWQTVKKLLVYGIALLALGIVISPWVPVNKALWSPSYTIITAGLAMLLLAGLMIVLDIQQHRRWAKPFMIAGANSIVFFMLSGLIARIFQMIAVDDMTFKSWLYKQVFLPLASPHSASLLFAVCFLIVCFLPVWWLYNKRIFVSI